MPGLQIIRKLFGKEGHDPADAPSPAIAPPQPRPPFPDAGPAARVVLYVEDWCSESRKAERLCIARGWPTRREDLKGRHDEKRRLLQQHGRRALPLIFIDGTFIGGYKELAARTELPAR